MKRTHVVIIGGGQAGLAMSRALADRGLDHVVLERGRVAQRWRSERWDSLRMLTPRWQSRLPGFGYQGTDPEGFMSMPEVIAHLERYARSFAAPVETETTVLGVDRAAGGYRVTTDRGEWRTANVVIATGHCDVPLRPALSSQLSPELHQTVPTRYRSPSGLPEGGVLVVGASASGVQLADELRRTGRRVVLSVGRHTRLPRRYRGHDILWWLDRMEVLSQRLEEVHDPEAAQAQPSFQLVGRPDHRSLDLATLQAAGVELVGRTIGARGAQLTFAEDLESTTAAADAKLARILARIDRFATATGLAETSAPAVAPLPFAPARAPASLDLRAEGISTILWSTGFARRYPWLKVPVLDQRGELRHRGGVTPAPGLYVIGLKFLRRRNSSFLDGVGADADDLANHVAGRAEAGHRRAA